MSVNPDPVLNLGLLGGMFDPVHNGHLALASAVLDRLGLDELLLVPCGNPVHREALFASSRHRIAMLKLALQGQETIRIDDRECRTADPSYTLNNLLAVKQERPGCRLFCIMGQDAFNSLPTWYKWKKLFDQAHIVVAARPGSETSNDPVLLEETGGRMAEEPAELFESPNGKILITRFDMLDISSSMVREKVARHEKIDDLVPKPVAGYITEHGLYLQEAGV